MSEFRKFMSYIYCYQGTVKMKNTGFAKMEAREEELRMQVSIKGMQLLPTGNCKVYVCVESGKYLQGICLGEMALNGGLGELNITTRRNAIMGEQVTLEEICGIYIKIKENQSVYMASAWNNVQMQYLEFVEGIRREGGNTSPQIQKEEDKEENNRKNTEVNESEHMVKEEETELASMAPQNLPMEEKETEDIKLQNKEYQQVTSNNKANISNMSNIIEIKQVTDIEFQDDARKEEVILQDPEPQEDLQAQCVLGGESPKDVDNCKKWEEHCEKHTWKDWLCNYKNIHPFECSGRVEVIRIEPRDMERLPQECWGLSNNSFLLHGYCSYRYIILYKNLDNEKVYLGVPGMYHPREKMIAGMFGFTEFVMARKAPLRQGEFGYYVREVCL